MKNRIIAILKRHRDIAKERVENVTYEVTTKLIYQAKADAFDQAIAIVEEVMHDQ